MTVVSPWAGLHIIPIGLHNMADLMVKYAPDLCPQSPKPLQASDIAPCLSLGFTRVLPQTPRNRPAAMAQGPGLGPGLGRAYKARARIESKEN